MDAEMILALRRFLDVVDGTIVGDHNVDSIETVALAMSTASTNLLRQCVTVRRMQKGGS